MSAPARWYQAGGPCCNGTPPIWRAISYGDRPDWMTEAQDDAITLINAGGILRRGTLHKVSSETGRLIEPRQDSGGRYITPPAPGFEKARAALPAARAALEAGLGKDANGRDLGQGSRTDRVRAIGGRAHILWCVACEKTAMEQFGEDLGHTLDAVAPVVRGIAIMASYVPVFGTAISFVLNTSLSLAQGQSIDTAALDGLGQSLPGQPASAAAFEAARGVLRGDSVDDITMNSIAEASTNYVTPALKAKVTVAIKAAVHIARAVAEGENIGSATLDEIWDEIPLEGKLAMGTARRLLNGDNVAASLTEESKTATLAALEKAKSEGEPGMNRYIAEAGYQGTLETVDPFLRGAITTGIMAGNIEAHQFIGTFDVSEKNVAGNDALAAKGQKIVDSGATWRLKRLSEVLKGGTYVVSGRYTDTMSGQQMKKPVNFSLNHDLKRRGFLVALGLCEGLTQDTSAQQQVRASLGSHGAQTGFDAGQWVQQERALPFGASTATDMVKSSTARPSLFAQRPSVVKLTAGTTPSIFLPGTGPKRPAPIPALSPSAKTKKAADRARWVAYYRGLAGHKTGTMTG